MRSRINATYPKMVKPELINIGDDIEVILPEVDGVVHTLRGKVAKREDHGNVRYLTTAEGYVILAWEPGKTNARTIIHGRTPVNQQSLFDVEIDDWDNAMSNIKQRIEQ